MFFSNRVSVCLPICQINQSFGKSTKLCFRQPYSKCSSRLIFGLRTSKFHRQKDNYSNLLIINKKMFFKLDLIIFINGLPRHQLGIKLKKKDGVIRLTFGIFWEEEFAGCQEFSLHC